jgi:hypothetical protein
MDYEACNYFNYRTEEIKEFLINCVEFFCYTKNRPEIKWVSHSQTASKCDARENKLTEETRECSLSACKHIKAFSTPIHSYHAIYTTLTAGMCI